MEIEKLDQDAFRKAVAEDKNKYVSRNSPYTVSFWKQVAVLTGRQFRLQSQDHFDLVTSFGMSIVNLNLSNQRLSKLTLRCRSWQLLLESLSSTSRTQPLEVSPVAR